MVERVDGLVSEPVEQIAVDMSDFLDELESKGLIGVIHGRPA